ncbi:hypothetical protein J3Q64DRAFT_1831791 [Phycomyces blakesleeanus]|uniref:No apical meristem-associated C-terminal domain-containing protein n=1 Tax=Phycomyces blakesleeanus TaxID=4837 RepID=A0ABR3B4M4_PHYBL
MSFDEKTGVFKIKRNRVTSSYKLWKVPDGGEDNRTPLERLYHFLFKDEGDNLNKYFDGTPEGETFVTTKTMIIDDCREYFAEQGIDQPAAQIKTRINYLIDKQYLPALNLMRHRKLEEICPEFFRINEIRRPGETESPCISNSGTPFDFANEYGLSSASRKKKISGKKRDLTDAQLDEERRKDTEKKLKVVDATTKAWRDEKFALQKAHFFKAREDRLKKEAFEADVKMIFEMASLFSWSEEKVQEEYEKRCNKRNND